MNTSPTGRLSDGPDFDIPDFDLDLKRPPCRLTARLRLVNYEGDDIGSKWQWLITINQHTWDSRTRILPARSRIAVDELIYDQQIQGGCGSTFQPVITIKAIEKSGWIADLGQSVEAVLIRCSREGETQRVTIPVLVQATLFLSRFLVRPRRKSAVLVFILDLHAVCVLR